ncbi:hypothetical protein AJ80_07367 [Polytolypa hystricis UAMH7299]|uniref:Ubiquitin-like-conjugating enzyme ATG10 n=1 Tax=Polytolypa hystricis (strain UAMH7299) TaxID=1447883 RepID=A0A2B7XNS3_POLH7|nr:hypothetical protein AJ80_07367 [Polytolypa hystricis UAMH7299]
MSESATSLASFPFLGRSEFTIACQAFVNRVNACGDLSRLGWTGVRFDYQDGEPVLVIYKTVDGLASRTLHREEQDGATCHKHGEAEDDTTEIEPEDDPEVLVRQPNIRPRLQVEYSVLLSPTYQVPVLYFLLHGPFPKGPEGLDFIYDCLVPAQYRSELKDVGVMGGISIGHHPISNFPAYFVHPCNTPDALRAVAGRSEPTAETYLFLWLGLVGNGVSLHVPSELLTNKSDQ